MNALLTPDKLLPLALALSAVLAFTTSQDPVLRWERAHSAPRRPNRLPWLILPVLALASTVFGVMQPLEFAAAFDGAILVP